MVAAILMAVASVMLFASTIFLHLGGRDNAPEPTLVGFSGVFIAAGLFFTAGVCVS